MRIWIRLFRNGESLTVFQSLHFALSCLINEKILKVYIEQKISSKNSKKDKLPNSWIFSSSVAFTITKAPNPISCRYKNLLKQNSSFQWNR